MMLGKKGLINHNTFSRKHTWGTWFGDFNEDVILDFHEINIKSTIQYLIDSEMLKIINTTHHHFIQNMTVYNMNPDVIIYDLVQDGINAFFKSKNIKIGFCLNVNLDIMPIDEYYNELILRVDLHIDGYESKCYANKIDIPTSFCLSLP